MKNILTIRSLAIFSFVIFFLPFVQMCSDNDLKKMEKREVKIDQNGNDIVSEINDSTDKKSQEHLSLKKKDATKNFYFISTLMLEETTKIKNIGMSDVPVLGFTVILFLSILVLLFSFTNKFKIVLVLSVLNLTILLVSTLILYLNIIENINQIKIGYYLFVLNTLAIIYFSRRLIKQKRQISISY